MTKVGIICEYNPFHYGHLHQINMIKKKLNNTSIICVMSGNFTQRGNVSILNKYAKTKVVLNYGVDLVVELPFHYATQSADTFSKGAIEILDALEVDYICFGSESADLEKLENLRDIKNDEFKEYLKDGVSYPKAIENYSLKTGNEVINTPNDILGACYLREIKKQKSNIKPFILKRTNDYHDMEMKNRITSATSIRAGIKKGKKIKKFVPKECYKELKNGTPDLSKMFQYIKYKIITEYKLNKFQTVDEGLENRIKKVIDEVNSVEELIKAVKSKRYTYNRISRMITHIFVGFTKEEASFFKDINFIRILGLNDSGQKIISEIKKDCKLEIINRNSKKHLKLLSLEKKADATYKLLLNKKLSNELSLLENKNHPLM